MDDEPQTDASPAPPALPTFDAQMYENARLLQARKVVLANRMRRGDDVQASELDAIAKAEIRLENVRRVEALRELTTG